MDADMITVETPGQMRNFVCVPQGSEGADIGPGVYGIHSPRFPSTEEIADRIKKKCLQSFIPTSSEVNPALSNIVVAAKLLRTKYAVGQHQVSLN